VAGGAYLGQISGLRNTLFLDPTSVSNASRCHKPVSGWVHFTPAPLIKTRRGSQEGRWCVDGSCLEEWRAMKMDGEVVCGPVTF